MNQEIFKKIEINDTLSLEFWNSEAQIKNYCEGILNHNNNTHTLSVKFSGKDAYVTTVDKKSFAINLPKIELINDEKLKLKNIIARTVFLRHELAHILYTDFNLQEQITNNKKLFNLFDDARIENLYSRQYKGTYRLFAALIKNIYEQSKIKSFTARANINDFGMYCRVREKGISPKITNIALESLYENLYKKYRYIFYNNYQILINGVKALIKEFESLEQDYQDVAKNSTDNPEKTSIDDGDTASKELNENTDNSNEEEIIEKEDSKSDDAEESEENETDGEDVEEDDDDEVGNTEEIDESDLDDDDNNKEDDEEDELQETVNELFNDEENIFDENQDFEFSKLLSNIADQKTNFDINQYDFDPKDFKAAQIVEFNKISKYILVDEKYLGVRTHPKTKVQYSLEQTRKIPFIRSDAQVIYNGIARQYKKTISETINYLKLKLKIRTNDKILRNQTSGKLDQRNLKDIFVNKNMPEVFYTAIKALKTDSAFYFLVDFSSSMSDSEKKDAIVCCIILTEICKTLNISYDIGLFASSTVNIYMTSTHADAIELSKKFSKENSIEVYSNGARKHGVRVHFKNNENLVYKIKNINEKHSVAVEQLLASIYSYTSIVSGGTPEFEATLSIIRNNSNKNTKKNIFIINDGIINIIKEIAQLPCNSIFTNGAAIRVSDDTMNSMSAEKLTELLFERLKISLINTMEFFKANDWIMDYNQNILYSQDIYKNYLEILNNPDQYSYIVKTAKKITMFGSTTYEIKIHQLFNQCKDYFAFDWRKAESLDMYKKAIHYAQKNGFNIHGFGIRSSYGKKYLGDQFQIFKDSKDIEDSFAAKIRNIF